MLNSPLFGGKSKVRSKCKTKIKNTNKTKIKGVGQECPTHTSMSHEPALAYCCTT
jgi:hypothetical protein